MSQSSLALPGAHRDNRKRPNEILWSSTEDSLLKNLAERYLNNWRLIADALNSSRIRTSVDLRTPFECAERWKARWSRPERSLANNGSMHGSLGSLEEVGASFGASPFSAFALDASPAPPTPTSTTASTSQMTTRGIKRLAANSVSQSASSLTVNTASNTVESRKRKRHGIINDMMRRTSKKREMTARANSMCS